MYATLLGRGMLHCSVEICYTAQSKYAILLGPSMLHCSVRVCYTFHTSHPWFHHPNTRVCW